MITRKNALKSILANTDVLPVNQVGLAQGLGSVLAKDISAPFPMPPFNKSAVDGYALNSAAVKKVPVYLQCIGVIEPGQEFAGKLLAGQCVKIMTGAPVPDLCDSVIMVEQTKLENNRVKILAPAVKGTNICFKGEDIRANQIVLKKNTFVGTEHIGLLASVGCAAIPVVRKPRLAILNTGSEIVPQGMSLGKNQIYNSNGPQLEALLDEDKIASRFLGIVPDDIHHIKAALKKGLAYDVLLVSGGVSMGDFDLIPKALFQLGVKEIFHKVKIKPGKPLFFGKKGRTLIFGIPGNPVSNFTTYQLFIRPALRKMMGHSEYSPRFKTGVLAKTIKYRSDRESFLPIRCKNNRIYLIGSHGSADVLALSGADGFAQLSAGARVIRAGAKLKFITWKDLK